MPYTPSVMNDAPIEGCPRITEEEFQDLEILHELRRSVERQLRFAYDDLLVKYGKKRVETLTESGYPGAGWTVSGHNIVRVIY